MVAFSRQEVFYRLKIINSRIFENFEFRARISIKDHRVLIIRALDHININYVYNKLYFIVLGFNLNMLLLISLAQDKNSRISTTNKKDLGILMLAMQTQEKLLIKYIVINAQMN